MSDPVATMTPGGDASKQTLEQYAAHLHAAFVRAITSDDLAAIARKLSEQARDGDRTSARLLLKYGLGDATLVKTDLTLKWQAKDGAARTAARAAAEPTAEQIMAQIHAKAREQAALEAEVRGRGAPSKSGDARPGTPGAAKGIPPGSVGR